MKAQLHKFLFPVEHAQLRDIDDVERHYRALVGTLFRTPQKESEWMQRFVDLDYDYRALEKQHVDQNIENMTLARENRALKDRLLGWTRFSG